MNEHSILDVIHALRWVIVGTVALTGSWIRMELKTKYLGVAVKELATTLDSKTDKTVCDAVHSSTRESQQIVLNAIETGIAAVREDIKHINSRIDAHLESEANGR